MGTEVKQIRNGFIGTYVCCIIFCFFINTTYSLPLGQILLFVAVYLRQRTLLNPTYGECSLLKTSDPRNTVQSVYGRTIVGTVDTVSLPPRCHHKFWATLAAPKFCSMHQWQIFAMNSTYPILVLWLGYFLDRIGPVIIPPRIPLLACPTLLHKWTA